MKKLLLILSIFLVAQLHAGIRIAMVTKHPAVEANAEKQIVASAAWINISCYGLLPNGQPKDFALKTDKAKLASDNIENCALFDLNRQAIRYIIYLNDDGTPEKIDFHMGETFESKTFTEFDTQTLIRIGEAKAYLESLP